MHQVSFYFCRIAIGQPQMDSFIIPLFIVAFVLVIVFSIYSSYLRTKALKELAQVLGYDFQPNRSSLPWTGYFNLFSKGRGRRVRNYMEGHQGDAKIAIFDYQYTTGSGKNSHTYFQTVVLIESASLMLPKFFLCPENPLHKIGDFLGFRDIDLPEYPRFSKQTYLKGEDEAGVIRVFNHRIVPFYETHPDLWTEGFNAQLIVYRQSRRLAPEQIRAFRDVALEAYRLFEQAAQYGR
jgi:hypothetical protein